MARHAPLLFTVAAMLAVAAASASASAYVSAADEGPMIIGGEDDVFGLGGVVGRRRLDDVNSTSPDASAMSPDANAPSPDANAPAPTPSTDDAGNATATATGFISYLALSRGSVPCSQRGASYYNCRPGAEANPYSRGCSVIARCRS